MYVDALTQMFAAQTALTAGTTYSNAYDLGTPNTPSGIVSASGDARDPSIGEDLIGIAFNIQVAAAGAAGTFEFDLIQAATGTLSSSPTVLTSSTILLATLVAGYKFFIAYPIGSINQRFIGARVVVGGSGTVTLEGWITTAALFDKKRDYPTAIQIL